MIGTKTHAPKDEYVLHVNEAVQFIRGKIEDPNFTPLVTITLGSGLGNLAGLIKPIVTISYKEIPNFPQLNVPGHEGTLIVGHLEGVPVLGYKGRKHFNETDGSLAGLEEVAFPVHVAASLGIKLYIVTNAAGGLNPDFKTGDVMVIRSHNGLFFPNPLRGPHHDFGGNDYFQPQANEYPKHLRDMFKRQDQNIKEGVYAALTGRTFEAPAESQALRMLGIDAVGMSTVPEIIIAANRGMDTFGVSVITNIIAPDGTNATTHEEVMAILNSPETEERLLRLFKQFFRNVTEVY